MQRLIVGILIVAVVGAALYGLFMLLQPAGVSCDTLQKAIQRLEIQRKKEQTTISTDVQDGKSVDIDKDYLNSLCNIKKERERELGTNLTSEKLVVSNCDRKQIQSHLNDPDALTTRQINTLLALALEERATVITQHNWLKQELDASCTSAHRKAAMALLASKLGAGGAAHVAMKSLSDKCMEHNDSRSCLLTLVQEQRKRAHKLDTLQLTDKDVSSCRAAIQNDKFGQYSQSVNLPQMVEGAHDMQLTPDICPQLIEWYNTDIEQIRNRSLSKRTEYFAYLLYRKLQCNFLDKQNCEKQDTQWMQEWRDVLNLPQKTPQ